MLSTIEQLNQDAKHVSPLSELDEEDKALRQSAQELMHRLSKVRGVVMVFEAGGMAYGRAGMDRYRVNSGKLQKVPSFCSPQSFYINTATMTMRKMMGIPYR